MRPMARPAQDLRARGAAARWALWPAYCSGSHPMRSALSLCLFLTACSTATAEPPQQAQLLRAISPPERLEPPAHLPEGARLILRNVMGSHAQNMSNLVLAIMQLHYDDISAGAESLAADASLSRPLTGDATELNSLLPPAFFDKQDQLRAQARELGAAAQQRNALAVGKSYGRLSETCVGCHAVYRGNP
jgi:hypothetical protein